MSIIIPDLGMSDMLVIFNCIKTPPTGNKQNLQKIIEDG